MKLPEVKGEYRNDYNLAHLTWFKVGGGAEVFFKPLDTEDLASFLLQNQSALPVTMLGAGSNIIIRDGGIAGVTIKLGQNFTQIAIDSNNNLSVGAGCLNFNLAQFCRINSIAGFEFLVGIPGTIGGGTAMNAGSYGREFKDIVMAVEALDQNGKLHILSNNEIGFSYRKNSLPSDFIITKVIFKIAVGAQDAIAALMNEISAKRQLTQPIKEKTGGSTFANPENHKAWELIDNAGMRGYRIGDAEMSKLHCNFMINLGNAAASDLENLGELVRSKVLASSGIDLKWEIKRMGKYE